MSHSRYYINILIYISLLFIGTKILNNANVLQDKLKRSSQQSYIIKLFVRSFAEGTNARAFITNSPFKNFFSFLRVVLILTILMLNLAELNFPMFDRFYRTFPAP